MSERRPFNLLLVCVCLALIFGSTHVFPRPAPALRAEVQRHIVYWVASLAIISAVYWLSRRPFAPVQGTARQGHFARLQAWLRAPLSTRQEQLLVYAFWLGLFATTVWMEWFPLQQAVATRGYLFYDNAADEHVYLQYDYSRALCKPTRYSQFLVTLAHECGLSGGWINFTLDTVCLLVVPLLFRRIFIVLGWSHAVAGMLGLGLCFLPAAFLTTANPPLNLFMKIVHSKDWLLYWISGPNPYYWYLPISRSPEPQISLILMACTVLVCLRWRCFWPAYLALPFLYSWVVVPFAFCLFVLHARYWLERLGASCWLAYPASALLVGLLALVHLHFLTPEMMFVLLANSRLPIISVTGLIALGLALGLRRWMPVQLRPAALAIALAPTVAVNIQIVTGYFATPHSFELNAGIICCALLVLFALAPYLGERGTALSFLVAMTLLIWHHGSESFRWQETLTKPFPRDPALWHALATDSENVALNNLYCASVASMLYPRQPITVFGDQTVSHVLPESTYERYLLAKRQIEADPKLAAAFTETFGSLDWLFRNMCTDWNLTHLGRRTSFPRRQDPVLPSDSKLNLRIFQVETP